MEPTTQCLKRASSLCVFCHKLNYSRRAGKRKRRITAHCLQVIAPNIANAQRRFAPRRINLAQLDRLHRVVTSAELELSVKHGLHTIASGTTDHRHVSARARRPVQLQAYQSCVHAPATRASVHGAPTGPPYLQSFDGLFFFYFLRRVRI